MRRNRLFIVSIIIVLIVTMTPGDGKIAGNYIDKVVHFMVFLILSINICYKFQKNDRRIEVMFWAILFGLLTEVVQQVIPGRNMDMYDGISDTVGIIVGYYIYRMTQSKINRLLLKLGA